MRALCPWVPGYARPGAGDLTAAVAADEAGPAGVMGTGKKRRGSAGVESTVGSPAAAGSEAAAAAAGSEAAAPAGSEAAAAAGSMQPAATEERGAGDATAGME